MEEGYETENAQVERTGRWTRSEHELFLLGLEQHGKMWKRISDMIRTRSIVQIRTHAQKYFLKQSRENGTGDKSLRTAPDSSIDNAIEIQMSDNASSMSGSFEEVARGSGVRCSRPPNQRVHSRRNIRSTSRLQIGSKKISLSQDDSFNGVSLSGGVALSQSEISPEHSSPLSHNQSFGEDGTNSPSSVAHGYHYMEMMPVEALGRKPSLVLEGCEELSVSIPDVEDSLRKLESDEESYRSGGSSPRDAFEDVRGPPLKRVKVGSASNSTTPFIPTGLGSSVDGDATMSGGVHGPFYDGVHLDFEAQALFTDFDSF